MEEQLQQELLAKPPKPWAEEVVQLRRRLEEAEERARVADLAMEKAFREVNQSKEELRVQAERADSLKKQLKKESYRNRMYKSLLVKKAAPRKLNNFTKLTEKMQRCR